MKRKPYQTDLSDAQWALLEPLMPKQKQSGRPRHVYLQEILNDLFYILGGGCTWRMMPHEFPAWKTVYHYFRLWRTDGLWQQMNRALREKVRQKVGRQPTQACCHS